MWASIIGVLLTGLAFLLLFPDRTDYAGHFLAGAGGTYWLLGATRPLFPRSPWAVVVAVWLAVGAGVMTEATVFRLAEFDVVDLANQSLGAVFAGVGMLQVRSMRRCVPAAAGAGLVFLVAGFHYAFA
jgi:hypothetical protein